MGTLLSNMPLFCSIVDYVVILRRLTKKYIV
nr:MAG TPA: hypothetical protein [Caudoviricetes sp.]